ncbi:MAG: amidohydrolase family protein [Chloroflexota bacterium]
MEHELTIIRGARLFDAMGTEHWNGASIWIEGKQIIGVYGIEAPEAPENARILDFPEGTILPGLMDSHTHLMYGTGERMSGPKSYDHVNPVDNDGLMLLRSVRNAYRHLMKAGVTTMRDLGARNRITFDLKDGASADLFKGFPTLHVCGRAITITGGHFHFCNEEADGEIECRKAVRKLVKEGADFIKVMGSGGGTYITDNRRASFTVGELRAIADETHRHGKICTVHAIPTESIANAVEAEFDCIEHYEFVELDDTRRFNREIAERMIENEIWLSPTIQTGYRRKEKMLNLQEQRELTEKEAENLRFFSWKQEGQLYATGKLYEMGARRFLMGTDAISEFGDYAIGLQLMSEAGLPNREVLLAATRYCAEAFGILDEVGTLEVGKTADITIVEGDPIADIKAIANVTQVVKNGYVLPMDSLELFPEGPGEPQIPPKKRNPNPKVIRLPEDEIEAEYDQEHGHVHPHSHPHTHPHVH